MTIRLPTVETEPGGGLNQIGIFPPLCIFPHFVYINTLYICQSSFSTTYHIPWIPKYQPWFRFDSSHTPWWSLLFAQIVSQLQEEALDEGRVAYSGLRGDGGMFSGVKMAPTTKPALHYPPKQFLLLHRNNNFYAKDTSNSIKRSLNFFSLIFFPPLQQI